MLGGKYTATTTRFSQLAATYPRPLLRRESGDVAVSIHAMAAPPHVLMSP